jgi:acyl-CoA thioesterase FadM
MSRIKIDLPSQFTFTTTIPLRITDVNYGGHVGNDTILSLIHEARVQFLAHIGYEELNLEGLGLIMSDVAIEFKKELFYGHSLRASVTATAFSRFGFDLIYKLESGHGNEFKTAALAKTGMVCYDYSAKKIAHLPQQAINRLGGA